MCIYILLLDSHVVMLKGAITCKKKKKVYNDFTLPKCLEKSDIFFDILPPCPDKDSSFHLNVVHYFKKDV